MSNPTEGAGGYPQGTTLPREREQHCNTSGTGQRKYAAADTDEPTVADVSPFEFDATRGTRSHEDVTGRCHLSQSSNRLSRNVHHTRTAHTRRERKEEKPRRRVGGPAENRRERVNSATSQTSLTSPSLRVFFLSWRLFLCTLSLTLPLQLGKAEAGRKTGSDVQGLPLFVLFVW